MDKVISRKEKRKSARHERKQHKHQALLQHQQLRKLKGNSNSLSKKGLGNNYRKGREVSFLECGSDGDELPQKATAMKSCYSQHLRNDNVNEREMSLSESESDGDGLMFEPVASPKMFRKDDGKGSKKKTKFEEYLEMETKPGALWEDDLEMERRLAKKLKTKSGKLKDDDDELNLFLKGIPSVLDSFENESFNNETENIDTTDDRKSKKKRRKKSKISELEHGSDNDASNDKHSEHSMSIGLDEGEADIVMEKDSEAENVESTETKKSKKRKRRKKSVKEDGSEDDNSSKRQGTDMSSKQGAEPEANATMEKDSSVANGVKAIGKYIAPHLRHQLGDNSQEYVQIRRRVRGLLNRLSESNVESVTGEISTIVQSVSRAVASQIISEEVLASCAGGPRGNEQYAAVFAAFVAGVACMLGIDFGARLMASLAKMFEDEYLKEDNLSLRNLSLLLSYLCIFGVCSSDLI